jgi:hypothetical protein
MRKGKATAGLGLLYGNVGKYFFKVDFLLMGATQTTLWLRFFTSGSRRSIWPRQHIGIGRSSLPSGHRTRRYCVRGAPSYLRPRRQPNATYLEEILTYGVSDYLFYTQSHDRRVPLAVGS